MAFSVGTKVILSDGKKGEVIATFGNIDCREFKVKLPGGVRHFTEHELLSELAATQTGNLYRFDMTQDCSVR